MQTKILSLVLLLSIVCYGTALRVIDQNAHKTLACCGPSNSFDTTTQICCINTVFPIPTAGSTLQNQCCGNRLLTTTQQCCVATPGAVSINDRAIDASASCCGTNALTDSTTQVCCSGTVVSNPTGLTQCCGNRLINPSTDLCCGTTFISGGAGKQCCGNAGFAPATQQCCGTTIVTNANGVQCCGSTSYDPTTQTCCGTKVGAGASMSCCGSLAYNQATQICCTDGVTSTVLSNTQGNLQCCGPAKTYDPTTQTCCSKSVDNYVKSGTDANGCATYTDQPTLTYTVGSIASGSCCDGIPYDSVTSICCLNKVISNPTNKQCCGTNLYDPSNDVCCPDPTVNGARVYTGKAAAGLECCVTSTFDPTTQACPCQVVISLNNDLSQNNNDPNVQAGCCGSTQYDANNKLCCANGNSLFNLDPAAGLQCCPQDGQTIYNPGYQVCCEKKVACPGKPSTSIPTISAPSAATISPSQNKKLVQCGDSCCSNGQGYFKEYQLCCDGEVVDFNNDAGSALTNPLSCCGNTIFNHFYEACCSEDLGNGKVNTAVYGGPGNWQLCCHN